MSFSSAPEKGHLSYWKWNFPAENAQYTALYPRSWTEYYIPECKINLICRQVSPVIPHNYKVSENYISCFRNGSYGILLL